MLELVMMLAGFAVLVSWGRCRRIQPVRGRTGGGVAGVEPGVFEGGLEAGFDGVGDVAVDLDDVFVESVAEAAGLGDFGDVGGDEPGFVAVP